MRTLWQLFNNNRILLSLINLLLKLMKITPVFKSSFVLWNKTINNKCFKKKKDIENMNTLWRKKTSNWTLRLWKFRKRGKVCLKRKNLLEEKWRPIKRDKKIQLKQSKTKLDQNVRLRYKIFSNVCQPFKRTSIFKWPPVWTRDTWLTSCITKASLNCKENCKVSWVKALKNKRRLISYKENYHKLMKFTKRQKMKTVP